MEHGDTVTKKSVHECLSYLSDYVMEYERLMSDPDKNVAMR